MLGIDLITYVAAVVTAVFFADAVRSARKWVQSKLFPPKAG